jgi:sporulation protein YhbH
MNQGDPNNPSSESEESGWYDLFSRGARDWLRHNEKIRETVKERLPDLIAGADVISRPENRLVQVPVRFLEHYRFRLNKPDQITGAGQGQKGGVKPGDILKPADQPGQEGSGSGGTEEGGLQFVLEFKVDEIVDWLWEELELPNLKPKPSDAVVDEEWVREGWDRRGVRSRLDRRRTMKEAIKRRSIQEGGPDFTDDDLRFRQLTRRQKPTTSAVVIFALDVSSSVREENRKLAKTFFFWALQGLRREYTHIKTVFIAHTVSAWEFAEDEFFQVTAEGGTQSSTAFDLALEILRDRYEPSRYNSYLFYASDGDNFVEDQPAAEAVLRQLTEILSFTGYVEVASMRRPTQATQMGGLFEALEDEELPLASYPLTSYEDIWPAIRRFFKQQAGEEVE